MAAVAVVESGERAKLARAEGDHQRVVRRLQLSHLLNVRWTDSRGCCQVSGEKEASRATCLRALPQLQSSAIWPWSRSSISSRTAFDAISGCAPGKRIP